MMSYSFARRSFLRATGASIGLRTLLRSVEASAEGEAKPLRFLVINRPTGTIRDQWLPTVKDGGLSLSPILAPFEGVKNRMVVVDGMTIVRVNGSGGAHEGNTVTLMTGLPVGGVRPGTDDAINTGPSIDQVLATTAPALKSPGFHSLQLGADGRDEQGDISNRTLSYAPGRDTPMLPELSPLKAYMRIFGSFMPGGALPGNQAQLLRARARRQSVLDFIRRDLTRLGSLAPSAERGKLDAHAAAIRELEVSFDRAVPATVECKPIVPPDLPTNSDADHGMIGALHLATVRTAFACDLTRVATFIWAPGASTVSFANLFPGMGRVRHHGTSHIRSPQAEVLLAAIDKWYSERTAQFVLDMQATSDPSGGKLLDSTLIVYQSECAKGSHHTMNLPVVVFGGPGVRIAGNRLVDAQGRSTNDLWLAAAQMFGAPLTTLGDKAQFKGPLPGVFG